MHISEGILHLPMLISTGIVAAMATIYGVKQLNEQQLPLTALFAAAFFVAGTIHIPVGIGSVHLILNGMAGLFLGWSVFPAFLIALILQTVFFSFGGFAVLGVNLCTMGLPALLAHYVLRSFISAQSSRKNLIFSGIGCAVIGIGGALLLTATFLYLDAGRNYLELIYLLIISHLPVLMVDAIISCLVIMFLTRMQPQIFSSFNRQES